MVEVMTSDGNMEVHRYPRPLYTGQLDESVKELLNTLEDALTDHKAVVIFINPFVAYRKGTVVRVKITVYPEDLEGEPEFGHRALGFLGLGLNNSLGPLSEMPNLRKGRFLC